jgi:putative CocE/NonD family hydrolase
VSESVRVERDLVCRAEDGTSLRTDVYRPAGDGTHPALLYRLPYGKTVADSLVSMPHPAWVAEQGFVVAVQDVRGRGGSDGIFQPFEHEEADGVAAVEWTSALDGCDGRVVSYGFSYPGLIQLLTAARRPRGLVGICPTFTGSQAREGWTYQGGALTGFSVEWALGLGSENARRAGDMAAFRALRGQLDPGSAWFMPGPDSPVAAALSVHFEWLDAWCAHPTDDGYWDAWDARSRYAEIDVPALHIGGWWDRFVRGTIENFTGLRQSAATAEARDAQRLVLGPWPHMPWSPLGEPAWSSAQPPAGGTVADLHLQWWRQLLYGEPSTLLQAPVSMWISGVGWHTSSEWPGSTNTESWYLHSAGRAATGYGDGALDRTAPLDERPDVLAYDPWMVGPRSGGHGCCVINPMGPACQCDAEQSPSVLVYTSDPLEASLLLIGDVSVEVWMAWDSPSVNISARLCVVDEAGCSTDVLDGVYRAGLPAAGSEHPLSSEPARFVIDLGPIGRKLAAGERIRLQLSGSDFPLYEINMADGSRWSPGQLSPGRTATQVFRHDAFHPSRLLLPVHDA